MKTPPHAHPLATAGPSDHERTRDAREEEQQLAAFRIHAAVFAGGMLVIFLVNLLTNAAAGTLGQWSSWWSAWALLGWGLGVAVHGLVVWLSRIGIADSPAEER